MQPRLVAKDLACRRGERLLFRGLSFACAPGDALLVAGANGIGKSSLIRMLAGLLRPLAGSVAIEGAIGLVDERLALDPNLPLGQALRFWERLDNCAAPAHAHEILQLEPLLDVPVRYLSTGQKKRAALARLLNRSCPIWLLDEPLNGLDTQAQASFEALIAQHCAAGGIALVASHQGIALPDPARVELAEYAV
ncbi:heme ABC exporter, ATP-binding protein CcmA [Erythrobacter sp. EhN03]|uniref:heme ABC exporter ATP-binding protein CcmA n=1 Tax=Qipengyuania flava TaxID=192812 RepID=UPI0007F47CBE|nr:heme ABC exporter ATP-binding protein CcmA [Qipengyuania flava]MCA0889681.1 heme ABC exporter ATP-binding protein CcmA [Qipengyuania flava]OAN86652.1 heme ABC exporter, ATP-binding protein CcmA [Erythrobacter sp. EhN03]